MKLVKKYGRTLILVLLVLTTATFYVYKLYDIQIVKGEKYYLGVADRSGTREEKLPAYRGMILDRYGEELAINVMSRDIVLDKAYIKDTDLNEIILHLCRLLESHDETWIDTLPIFVDEYGEYQFKEKRNADISALIKDCRLQAYATAPQCMAALITKYGCESYSAEDAMRIISVRNEMRAKEYSFRYPYTFARNVSIETVSVIEENDGLFPGVRIENTSTREYVNGGTAPHIVGMIGALSASQYADKKDEGYALNDVIGQFGIESKLESILRGQSGIRTITFNQSGKVESSIVTEEPTPGYTVYLSIDSKLQNAAQKALEDNIKWVIESAEASGRTGEGEDCSGGAAIVMECKTGKILAMVTWPTFNLTTYAEDLANNAFGNGALLNRALESVYPPGSVMKPAIALAALSEGIVSATSTIPCNHLYTRFAPEVFQCLGWHGAVSVRYGLQVSCNCFFYESGYLLGISRMNDYSKMLGLGEKTGIELNELKGTLAGPGTHKGGWFAGDTIQAAIGQSDNAFTITQLASYVSTLANGGTRYQPTVVDKIMDYSSKNVIDSGEPVVAEKLNIDESYFRIVREGMRQAVTGGSVASVLANYPIPLAGKTGTAQAGKGSDHGLLATFAPYDDPEIAVVVVLEHGGHGYSAAYTVQDIMDAYFGIDTDGSDEEEILEGETIPTLNH